MADKPEHELTSRGFKHYTPVATCYGATVEVRESSSAAEPRIWLSIDMPDANEWFVATQTKTSYDGSMVKASAHMNFEQIDQLIVLLQQIKEQHYQVA